MHVRIVHIIFSLEQSREIVFKYRDEKTKSTPTRM